MAATPSVRIVKSFNYRGQTQLWSNRYHITGGSVPDQSHFNTLADNITADEKQCLPSDVSIVEAIYYNAGSDVPVFSKSYSLAGTMTPAGSSRRQAGDVTALVRYATAARSSKNHPVYLFNYYHACFTASSGNDTLESGQSADLLSYGNQWITGYSDGATTYHRAGPNGAAATGVEVEQYVTHRDFPR